MPPSVPVGAAAGEAAAAARRPTAEAEALRCRGSRSTRPRLQGCKQARIGWPIGIQMTFTGAFNYTSLHTYTRHANCCFSEGKKGVKRKGREEEREGTATARAKTARGAHCASSSVRQRTATTARRVPQRRAPEQTRKQRREKEREREKGDNKASPQPLYFLPVLPSLSLITSPA